MRLIKDTLFQKWQTDFLKKYCKPSHSSKSFPRSSVQEQIWSEKFVDNLASEYVGPKLINCRNLPIYFNHSEVQNETSCLSVLWLHLTVWLPYCCCPFVLSLPRAWSENNKSSFIKVNQIVTWMLLTTQDVIALHWFASSLPRKSEVYMNWFFLPLWIRKKCPNVTS